MAERSTVEGAVQSLIFQNEDNGYTVLSLLTDDGEPEREMPGNPAAKA